MAGPSSLGALSPSPFLPAAAAGECPDLITLDKQPFTKGLLSDLPSVEQLIKKYKQSSRIKLQPITEEEVTARIKSVGEQKIQIQLQQHNPFVLPLLQRNPKCFQRRVRAFVANMLQKERKERLFQDTDIILDQFAYTIPYYNHSPKEYEGHLERILVSSGTQTAIRADLHGNLPLLLNTLNSLKETGFLDEYYLCKENVHLVFAGDLTGKEGEICDLEVVNILALMKILQPNNVHIIRGNHEELYYWLMYSPESGEYSRIPEREKRLREFSNRLPLAIWFTEKDIVPRKYVGCVHGSLDPTVNLRPLLDGDKEIMLVPRLTPENMVNYKQKVSLWGEEAANKFSEALWEHLSHSTDQLFLRPGLFNSDYPRFSSYTWGSTLPKMPGRKYIVANRGKGDISCSHAMLSQFAQLSTVFHSIKRLYQGHEHLADVFHPTEEAPLFVRILPWEIHSCLELQIAIVTFVNGKIQEQLLQKAEQAAAASS